MLLCCHLSVGSWGQVMISNATPVTQNFDGIGTSGTATLPSDWKMSAAGATSATWSAVGNFTAVSQGFSSGTPTAGGRYNWGNGTTTSDRAIGFMTSGGYASPNSIMVNYLNNNSQPITQLSVSFDIERYRINTANASVQFSYSLDGSTWTSIAAGDVATSSLPTGTSSYTFSSGTIVSLSNVIISSLNITNGSDFYLKWNFNTTGSNSQGIGLDNVSVSASFGSSCTPPTVSATGLNTTSTSNAINLA